MELVRDALDYRKWFEFQMFFRRGEETKKPLTNAAFNRFSGGEKAMAMYVPLFGAVNAQYKKADNKDHPRIIALDEAFAGVDDKNIKSMFELVHSLYEYKLKKVVVNGSEIIGTDSSYDAYEKKYFGQTGMELDEYLIDKYHRQIEKSSNFPHINSYILMITEMMFFTESRDFAFWEEELCKSILSKFMPRDKYFEYDEIQKLVKKYDSQARLTSYKMSMIKDFLGDEFSEKVDESFQYSLEDLQKINTQVDLVKSRIERIEKDLSSNEKEKTQNRIESERVNKKMLDIEKLWYENIFPDSYQGMFNRYVPSILSGKCPFCGTEHLDIKVNVENCFFCKKVIKTKEKANLDEIEIERKNLEFERRRLQNNFDLLKKENANLKRSLREEETELYVYMFYMSDVKKETLMSRIDNKTNELLRGLSDELNSIFDGVEMNDMKCWGTAS